MRVVVLGAGIIGVTTAYYLARQGVEVEVLDRQREAGLETSFANAGELSYGMTSPWAAPDSVEGRQMDVHAPPPTDDLAAAEPIHVVVVRKDGVQLQCQVLCHQ
jgi:glycine/D-amino acid oxidase-like deaminating enzyme